MTQVGEATDKSLFIARAIRDGLRKAKDWIAENEGDAISIASREFGVSKKVVRSAWRRFSFCAKLNPETEIDFVRDAELMARYAWYDSKQISKINGFVRMI